MSVTKLPSGRWRAHVWDPAIGKNVSVSKVLGGLGTFATKAEAKRAREKARERLGSYRVRAVTVHGFWERWTTDPLFSRPKESTDIHNRERTKAFAEKYRNLPLVDVGDEIVAEWLVGGENKGTIPALRVMFNDAASAKAGRLIPFNPFAGLGLSRTRGNRDKQPPSQQQLEEMVAVAWEITPPSFAGYLEFGAVTAIRPGELDALAPDAIDYRQNLIDVTIQWNVKAQKFTEPKYGPYKVALVARARDVLARVPKDEGSDLFVFPTIRGTHYTPSSRTHHWNRVRAAVGLPDMTLYLATRHYFGWYAINILLLAPHVVAEQLGHKDGGKLVSTLYGHPDKALAREQIRNAHDQHARVTPLRSPRRISA